MALRSNATKALATNTGCPKKIDTDKFPLSAIEGPLGPKKGHFWPKKPKKALKKISTKNFFKFFREGLVKRPKMQ